MHAYDPRHADSFGIFGNDSLYIDNSTLAVMACLLTVLLAAATWRMWKTRTRTR